MSPCIGSDQLAVVQMFVVSRERYGFKRLVMGKELSFILAFDLPLLQATCKDGFAASRDTLPYQAQFSCRTFANDSAALSGSPSSIFFEPSFSSLKAFAYGFNRNNTCLFFRGFFFCTPTRFVLASPLAERTTACTSDELIRRLISALWMTFEGSKKSFFSADGVVVDP